MYSIVDLIVRTCVTEKVIIGKLMKFCLYFDCRLFTWLLLNIYHRRLYSKHGHYFSLWIPVRDYFPFGTYHDNPFLNDHLRKTTYRCSCVLLFINLLKEIMLTLRKYVVRLSCTGNIPWRYSSPHMCACTLVIEKHLCIAESKVLFLSAAINVMCVVSELGYRRM